MEKKQMLWLRIIVLPLSLFTLIVALDQNQSWLVVLAILLIISIILWWYFDEIHAAKERKVLTDNVLDIAATLDINKAKLSLIEEELKKALLMEKFYQFDTCRIKKEFGGIYREVAFEYKEVEMEGTKNFVGHVLTLFINGSTVEKVAMYDAFPYNEEIKKLTIVGSNEHQLEVSVEGVLYFEQIGLVKMKESMEKLLKEIDDIIDAYEVKI